jgi:outer membrane immunogenic protein
MRPGLLALMVAGVVGCACPAAAANMPVKARTAAAVVAHNWSGYYVGGNAGYSWGANANPTATVLRDPLGAAGLQALFNVGGNEYQAAPHGFIGGGQIGSNWQASGSRWVVGLEADFQYADVSASETALTNPPPFAVLAEGLSLELKWFGTVRGRVGYTFGENGDWLFYGTGGLAYGRVTTSMNFDRVSPPSTPLLAGSASEWRIGWTAGAGLERAYGAWVLGLEYLYYDLGRTSVTTGGSLASGVFAGQDLGTFVLEPRVHGHIVRGRLSYRLGNPPPPP